ncbi:MAG TPA: AraC family transcriptional regulator, partial [Gemmatimonadales bacterium]|nr:AraC family transcriptional regulator [Gemmatimonadales bacterium]
HLISYHILTEGRCFGGLVGEEPVELAPGDVIVFPQGDAHVMASGNRVKAGPEVQSSPAGRYPETVILGGKGSRSTSLVCGFLGCDRRPFNPLLASLPRRLHMRGLSSAWLGSFTRQVTEESRLGRAGAACVLTRLAEVMFIEVVRRYLENLPPGQTGWLAGLRDEVVGRVLAVIHGRPDHAWSLTALAREGATSRSSLAKRFAEQVGQPPMQYLARWRMQVAANLLAHGGGKIAAIGMQVGYDSEAAFSRAFKKATGLAPGAWREGRRVPGPQRPRLGPTGKQEVGTFGHWENPSSGAEWTRASGGRVSRLRG